MDREHFVKLTEYADALTAVGSGVASVLVAIDDKTFEITGSPLLPVPPGRGDALVRWDRTRGSKYEITEPTSDYLSDTSRRTHAVAVYLTGLGTVPAFFSLTRDEAGVLRTQHAESVENKVNKVTGAPTGTPKRGVTLSEYWRECTKNGGAAAAAAKERVIALLEKSGTVHPRPDGRDADQTYPYYHHTEYVYKLSGPTDVPWRANCKRGAVALYADETPAENAIRKLAASSGAKLTSWLQSMTPRPQAGLPGVPSRAGASGSGRGTKRPAPERPDVPEELPELPEMPNLPVGRFTAAKAAKATLLEALAAAQRAFAKRKNRAVIAEKMAMYKLAVQQAEAELELEQDVDDAIVAASSSMGVTVARKYVRPFESVVKAIYTAWLQAVGYVVNREVLVRPGSRRRIDIVFSKANTLCLLEAKEWRLMGHAFGQLVIDYIEGRLATQPHLSGEVLPFVVAERNAVQHLSAAWTAARPALQQAAASIAMWKRKRTQGEGDVVVQLKHAIIVVVEWMDDAPKLQRFPRAYLVPLAEDPRDLAAWDKLKIDDTIIRSAEFAKSMMVTDQQSI
jgi:hypothetical protein